MRRSSLEVRIARLADAFDQQPKDGPVVDCRNAKNELLAKLSTNIHIGSSEQSDWESMYAAKQEHTMSDEEFQEFSKGLKAILRSNIEAAKAHGVRFITE